jgi:hypothetical protein
MNKQGDAGLPPSVPIQYPGRFHFAYETGQMSLEHDGIILKNKSDQSFDEIPLTAISSVEYISDKTLLIVITKDRKKHKIRIGMSALAGMSESNVWVPSDNSAHSVAETFADEWVKPWLDFFSKRGTPLKQRTSASKSFGDIFGFLYWFR